MANSVVRVTENASSTEDDNVLVVLVGKDGTVTPDKDTAKKILSSKNTTNVKIMRVNAVDAKGVECTTEEYSYIHDYEGDDVNMQEFENIVNVKEMDEVTRILYNIQLDHDYTPYRSLDCQISAPTTDVSLEDDELAKTLSLLEGGSEISATEPPPLTKIQPATPAKTAKAAKASPGTSKAVANKEKEKSKPKVTPKAIRGKNKAKKEDEEQPEVEDFDLEEEEEEEAHEEEGDEDWEVEETKSRPVRRSSRRRTRSETKSAVLSTPKVTKAKKEEIKTEPPTPAPVKESKEPAKPVVVAEKPEEEAKPAEKKPAEKKKEKKPPKPIPDDFALFSTPDIIRRVGGGKEQQADVVGSPNSPSKPAKITQENRSKSASESSTSSGTQKQSRLSMDSKISDKSKDKDKKESRRMSTDNKKRVSIDEKKKSEKTENKDKNKADEALEDIIPNLIEAGGDLGGQQENNINLDTAALDLDPALLENLSNDLMSEDILYQMAQSFEGPSDILNVFEKGDSEAKSLLEGSNNSLIQPNVSSEASLNTDNDSSNISPNTSQTLNTSTSSTTNTPTAQESKKGTQIVRPDGRILIIPPIERPTTRSRNKKTEEEKPKPAHKPLDEEHVSGNELDEEEEEPEANDEEEEEESEDDPNKLWCICNQPHNNRFMICCDTCEEWYHGKCVNITKAMGQQMEAEGKEWICLFCKDSSLKRPQAAARRVRKASRNSRTSTDSANSTKKSSEAPSKSSTASNVVPCVVCQKPARKSSIFCSEACILAHAQGVERVLVYEKSSGNLLSGSDAPSAANLNQWLKEHPGYEVIRSRGKIVTAKAPLTQSKLKIVKNVENEGVSLAVQKKGVNVGLMKHSPKNKNVASPQQGAKQPAKPQQPTQQTKPVAKPQMKTLKLVSKQVSIKEQPKVTKVTSPAQTILNKLVTKPKQQIQTTLTKSLVKTSSPTTPKPVPTKTPQARKAEQPSPQQKQENIRDNVQKTLFEKLTSRLKAVEDLKLTEEEVKAISVEIEAELYKCFGDVNQKYRNKYRSLIFNIKDMKNQTLWRRICEKSINPYELVRLSPDDLASQELAMWREREAKHQLDMIKKSELELLNCNRQYVLKTHKGEQVLEDKPPTDTIDNNEVIKSLTEGSSLDSTDSKSEKDHRDKKGSSSSKHAHKDKDHKSRDKEHRNYRSSSKDRDRSRRRSRSREHSSRRSDKKSSKDREKDKDRHRKSSTHRSSRHKKSESSSTTDKLDKKSKEILEQLVDKQIVPPLDEERLWKPVVAQEEAVAPAESDSDHEPSSTVTIPTPPRVPETEDTKANPPLPTEQKSEKEKDLSKSEKSKSPPPKVSEIWRGTINMIDVAQISIAAYDMSGDSMGLGTDLPSTLDIVGRINPDTVWDYIGKIKNSNSKAITLLRLKATSEEEKMPYIALYSYLNSRTRLGVVKSTNKAVKDFYIYPLPSKAPIPQVLLPLSGSGFEEPRSSLLLGIIVRDRRKRPAPDELPPAKPVPTTKKVKVEIDKSAIPTRSYTPPPIKDPRLTKLPLPPDVSAIKDTVEENDDDDEPYEPEDSDPDTSPSGIFDTSLTAPLVTAAPLIPGLDVAPLPSSASEIQRQMEELNKKIEMQKSEINSISQNIATASTDLGTSVLANIALPSNIHQILDSIKTIGATSTTESVTKAENIEPTPGTSQSDLTIPLMLPNNFSRPLNNTVSTESDTIPLNLPTTSKLKAPTYVGSPVTSEPEKSTSVLSSLSEEDLIRKAAEMLGESDPPETTPKRKSPKDDAEGSPVISKKRKLEEVVELPPVPGLD